MEIQIARDPERLNGKLSFSLFIFARYIQGTDTPSPGT